MWRLAAILVVIDPGGAVVSFFVGCQGGEICEEDATKKERGEFVGVGGIDAAHRRRCR